MAKNQVVKKLQNAHLYAWLGDYEMAARLIEEVQDSDEKLANILGPTLEKKGQEYQEQHKKSKDLSQNAYKRFISDIAVEKTLTNHEEEYIEISTPTRRLRWRYSINMVSMAWGETKYEIKAFNPEGDLPRIVTLETIYIEGWTQEHGMEGDHLRWIALVNPALGMEMIITLDHWGLLSGTAVTMTGQVEELVRSIYSVLEQLDELLWD